MKRYIGFIILSLACSLSVFAQDDVRTMMNNIKMDDSYYKVEINDTSKVAALEEAVWEMLELIDDDVKAKGLEPFTPETLTPHLHTLELWRGERIRLLAYTKRATLLGEEAEENTLLTAMQDSGILSTEETVESADSAQLALVPTEVSQDSIQAAAPQEPIEVAAAQDSVQTEAPVLDEVAKTEAAVLAAAAMAADAPAPVVEMIESEPASTPAPQSEEMQVVLESIMQMETARDVLDALKQFKAEGRIKDYGGLRSAQNNTDSKYIVIFTKENQRMVSFLSPSNQGKRMDLFSQKEDSLENHKGEIAILFE